MSLSRSCFSKDVVFANTSEITGGLSSLSISKVHACNIDIRSVANALFIAPVVIHETPLTLDQQVTAALSRLHVSIEANANYALVQMAAYFDDVRYANHWSTYWSDHGVFKK
jgi:hypothetical protein